MRIDELLAENAELKAEVAMLAAAAKARSTEAAVSGGSGKFTITRSQLAAKSALERMNMMRSGKFHLVDD